MNRVYKIVWSKAKNAYVVTSELAKNHTKNASGKMVKTALTAAVGMGVLMGGYMADAAPATNPSGDGPGIAIGTGSSSQKVDSTAVGKNAKTTGERALAVGYNSIADADSAMAVGNGNKAMAGGSLAVGARNIAQGMGGLAIGESNTAKGDDSAAVGHSNKVHAMGTYAFGLQNTVWKMYSQAYGMNNIVSEINSFAYGNSNQVGSMNSFAFGGANLNTARWAVTVGNTNKVGGEHSFAAGFYNTIGSTSKDAVAIGQNARVGVSDFNVATTIDPTTGEIKAVYNGEVDATNSVAIGNEANVMALNSVALGENTGVTKDGKNGTAIGGEASVKAENGTAAGFKATVRAKSGVALGASSFVDAEGGIALGRNSVAERKSGRAGYDFTTGAVSTINDSTWKATDGAVSVGNSANTRQITRVAAGTEDTDAVNVAQIKGLAKQFTADGVSYFHVNATNTAVAPVTNNKGTVSAVAGAGGKNSTAAGIAAKVQKDAEESTAIGYSTNVTKKNGTVVGNRSSVSGEGGSAFGYNSQANDVNATAIGAASRATKEGAFAGGYSAQATGIRSVAVGSGAKADSTSTVAIGDGANVASNVDLVGGIAIGKKAYVLNGGGRQEAELGLDRSNWPASISGAYNNPINKDRVATGIAIGTNAYARTGSVQIGAHTYTGTMGGTSINANTNGEGTVVNMTTIGSNSYNKAVFGTMVGAYSIASGDFNGSGGFNRMYTGQNFGASVVGSLNSIRTKGYGQYSGIANSIVGLANTTENSNGSLIFGAGNNITNSIKNISGVASGANTPDEMSAKLRKAIQDNESGGAVMALGGGNTADWAQASQIVGVNNTLKGTRGNISKYNLIDGYKNTADRVSNVSVIGSENNVTNTNGAVVFGDKRTLTGADGSVVIGSSQAGTSTSVKNAVAIGSEANVTKEGGVALGAGSVASVDKGVAGYDPGTGTNSTDTSSVWKSTQAAVSVGDTSKGITRQITGVAAGTNDTDAVNVAQLRKAKTSIVAAASTEVRAGTNITSVNKTADPGDGHAIYTINAKDTVVTGGTATYASNGAGTATLTNSDGTTATVTGLQDRYTSSASLSGDTLNFTRNDGSTYSVSGIASSQDIKNVTNKVGELGTRVNRVGAGAAALAALHPLDFDPDDKWDFAAGYGNYKDAHAVSVGAFYRPNEDTMFSVGGSFGAGENMVNAGVSVKLGQGNHVSTSKVAMAKEIVDLRDENKDLKKRLDTMEQKMNSILGILDMGKKKDFPDVPENHWAYEYVATLAGNGIIEGYPDGEFKGDRSMTRYEFAAMFYRALKNGAPVDDNMDRAMNEFEPELRQIRLDRIRVDRISGKDNDRNKVERVRVNSEDDKAKNDYRDVYGSHISPKA